MFRKYADEKKIRDLLTDAPILHPLSDRAYWEGFHPTVCEQLAKQRAAFDSYVFEVLPASLWMEFTTQKNRTNYQEKRAKRECALLTYALSEAIENKEKYRKNIIDLVWMIL